LPPALRTPPGTRSLALVCSDPDAPAGTWHHWAIYDIAADATGLDAGYPADAPGQAVNDFNRVGYGGPCPPKGHGVHRYRFRLMALDVEGLGLGPRPTCADVESAAAPHMLADTVLTGVYSR